MEAAQGILPLPLLVSGRQLVGRRGVHSFCFWVGLRLCDGFDRNYGFGFAGLAEMEQFFHSSR